MIGTGVDIGETVAALFFVGGLFIGGASFTWLLIYRVNPWWFAGLCLILPMLAIITVVFGVKLLTGFFTGVAFTSFIFTWVRLMDKGFSVDVSDHQTN